MPRPKTCRRICGYPDYWSFAPEDGGSEETIAFMLDEYEAIRLIDYQKLTQEECASAMGVSRATVTAIYERARYKLASALVDGKRIRITGGSYKIDAIPDSILIEEKGEDTMRAAVTYEDEMVGQHFGRTEQFKIYDVKNGEVISSKVIDTNGTGHGALAGFLRAAEVEVLICGGIGMGARSALEDVGIKLLPGVKGNADAALQSYIAGNLNYDPDTQCNHHSHEAGHDCSHGNCNNGGCH